MEYLNILWYWSDLYINHIWFFLDVFDVIFVRNSVGCEGIHVQCLFVICVVARIILIYLWIAWILHYFSLMVYFNDYINRIEWLKYSNHIVIMIMVLFWMVFKDFWCCLLIALVDTDCRGSNNSVLVCVAHCCQLYPRLSILDDLCAWY